MSDTGYGFQNPYDSSSDELGTAFMIRRMLANVDTVKIVQVVAVKPGSGSPPIAGTVDVQILVNQIDGATPPNSTPAGKVYGLPYARIRFGVWEIVGDPAINDIGIALCSDRDISTVKNTKAQANPASLRQHDIADGLFLGGCLNGAPSAYLWLKTDGTFKISDKTGNVIETSTSGITMTPVGGPLTVNGAIVATGNITGNGIDMDNHVHSGVQSGSDNTGPPTG